eukprot:g1196.t1
MPEQDKDNTLINNDAFLNATIDSAFSSRDFFSFSSLVPDPIFLNDVLPYSVLSEDRNDYRFIFSRTICADVQSDVTSDTTAASVVEKINSLAWSIVHPPIKFQAAPPDTVNEYSVFSVMAAKVSSCTGLAVYLTAVLRSCGIPARVAGVPHWNLGKQTCPDGDASPSCGNHDWVEVYLADQQRWAFVDPAGSLTINSGWFYPSHTKFQVHTTGPSISNHSIYASSYASLSWQEKHLKLYPVSFPVTHFPMVWNWTNNEVGGWERTLWYSSLDN